MSRRDPLFSSTMRESSDYRRDRLQVEHERLMRRLEWAMARNDEAAIEWLDARLSALEAEMNASIDPNDVRLRRMQARG